MFSSTTDEFETEHSAPFTIEVAAETVDPRAPHAAVIGMVGAGVGDDGVDEDPPPPQAAASTMLTITSRFLMISP